MWFWLGLDYHWKWDFNDSVTLWSQKIYNLCFKVSLVGSPTSSGMSFITCVGLKVTKRYYENDDTEILERTGIDLNQWDFDFVKQN